MKIVFVNSCGYFGGAEIWHLNTAIWMKERGHQVTIMARPGPLAERAQKADIPVITVPMSFDLDLLSFVKAYAYFRQEKPDLVILNDQRECRLIAPAAMLAGVKVRVQRKAWPFLKGSWRDRLVYGKFVTHMFGSSEAVTELFKEKSGLPPDRISLIPTGIDISGFTGEEKSESRDKLGLPRQAFIIGSVGRLVSQKAFDVLIRAASVLKENGHEFMVAIAGEGPLEEGLRDLADKLGVREAIKFMGFVEDMPAFFSALDIYVSSSRMESRARSMSEAMAAGLPIITTDAPGNDELVVKSGSGIVVPADAPQKLAEAVENFMTDSVLLERYGKNAKDYAVTELDSKIIVEKLEQYLEGLLADETGA